MHVARLAADERLIYFYVPGNFIERSRVNGKAYTVHRKRQANTIHTGQAACSLGSRS
jgi:hypothetical protein